VVVHTLPLSRSTVFATTLLVLFVVGVLIAIVVTKGSSPVAPITPPAG
jgi:hypothetical protein